MSGIISGLVLRQPVTQQFTSEMKFTAMAYADHAWEDGTHAYPAVATIATMTGYHERSVQRYLRALQKLGMMVPDGRGPRGTISYKFPIKKDGPNNSTYLDLQPQKQGGDTLPPRQAATPGGDRDSGDRDSGDTGVTRIIKPLLKPKEEEGTKPQKIDFSPALEKALTDSGIYKPIWPEIAKRLGEGWSDADIFALLSWMVQANGKPARFVARIRDGTKAPEKYYPPVMAAEDEEPEGYSGQWLRVELGSQPSWWPDLIEHGMAISSRKIREQMLNASVAHRGDELIIAVDDPHPDVLEARLLQSLRNALPGVMVEPPTQILFVSAETEPA